MSSGVKRDLDQIHVNARSLPFQGFDPIFEFRSKWDLQIPVGPGDIVCDDEIPGCDFMIYVYTVIRNLSYAKFISF